MAAESTTAEQRARSPSRPWASLTSTARGIGHEYTHAISNRMAGGPDDNLTGAQAGAMGESWSDLVAMEYLNEYGLVPTAGESPYAVGTYATGNIGYDMTGVQVHADGEIWSAANFDMRSELVAKYDGQYPSTDADLQRR